VPAAAESAMATAMAATTLGKLLRAALTSRIVLAGSTVTTSRPSASALVERGQAAQVRAVMIATVVRRTVMLAPIPSKAVPTASSTPASRSGGSGVRAPDVAS